MLWTPLARTRPRGLFPLVLAVGGLMLTTTSCLGLSKSSGADARPATDAEVLDTQAPQTVASTVAKTTEPTTTTSTTTTSTTTTTTTTTLPPTTTTEVPVLDRGLRAVGGRSGRETKRVQQRLLDLGFWVLKASGRYDLTTKQAVMAFQKYSLLRPTGRVDLPTAQALTEATAKAQARTTNGNLVEVDKDRQVLFFVQDGVTQFVLNTSTGNGQYFLELNQKVDGKYEAGRAVTPSGKFKISRQREDGWWEGDLGKIYRPKYFNGGRAIHGSSRIPARPASHGCVRVSIPAMDMLWTLDWVGRGLRVWVYGEDVEAKNKPIPIPPPTTTPRSTSSTTTSSTTTTSTTTTTTLAPSPN
ncbi:MAG: L,D-transpeptidase family protein [Actinobacteria bacterium]|nr:L,D-transpeptidase family protein [Actinomycetota bacterium]MSY12201.1 L,D-transpeptidase family protein [Actinomycetota bacterium]MSZ04075.1 L,D-transpeptidase family protein [Actinomycetota bacterium]MTB06075.1 L,D-transpeptidase family protein [Actinomycetota bacterium]